MFSFQIAEQNRSFVCQWNCWASGQEYLVVALTGPWEGHREGGCLQRRLAGVALTEWDGVHQPHNHTVSPAPGGNKGRIVVWFILCQSSPERCGAE